MNATAGLPGTRTADPSRAKGEGSAKFFLIRRSLFQALQQLLGDRRGGGGVLAGNQLAVGHDV